MSDTKLVVLNNDKCNGCDRCMKRCPTEAIRIKNRKATISYERCVGCGECVRICPSHAKAEVFDSFENIKKYKYKIALPCPSIFGQFDNITDINYILTAFKRIGFDDIFEVSIAAEILSDAYGKLFKSGEVKRPIISSACPAVKNLILMRYDYLIENISPYAQPEAIAAQLALERALIETGLPREDIGIILISQCAANVVELHTNYSEYVDEVLGFKELYLPLLNEIKKMERTDVEDLSKANWSGIICGSNTGEEIDLGTDNFLTASGIENVLSVLNELEKEKLNDLDFIELYACTTGCTGGSLNMENCFIARTRLRRLRNFIPMRKPLFRLNNFDDFKHIEYEPNTALRMSDNRIEALKMMIEASKILDSLPKFDCGSCGAPTCKAFAEDFAKGIRHQKCRYVDEDKLAIPEIMSTEAETK